MNLLIVCGNKLGRQEEDPYCHAKLHRSRDGMGRVSEGTSLIFQRAKEEEGRNTFNKNRATFHCCACFLDCLKRLTEPDNAVCVEQHGEKHTFS